MTINTGVFSNQQINGIDKEINWIDKIRNLIETKLETEMEENIQTSVRNRKI